MLLLNSGAKFLRQNRIALKVMRFIIAAKMLAFYGDIKVDGAIGSFAILTR